ncbi:hypothetical protein A5784_06095 [Mycobacterium sp. 852013-50091_SCH5140682]|uniref:hypothetical protein n=1 Tax=Mycobacterium sp. 852013-50091_SCH5140682 TaxID=1834109 RepID=UPI0007E9707E|nr:hypothetical protein [Mycobacterium sp. 852013-50091_SCH5140682]OBC08950.1 hypothetical protein A5784_06095 [Mycobacterium sp. 852013-50091_SCH5140682]
MDVETHSRGKILAAIGVPVAITLLSGATVPWWWHEVFDRHSVDDSSTAHNSSAPSARITAPPTVAAGTCAVTVANPLLTLRETPDPFGQESVKVAAGTYKVSDIADTSWAGAPQRWFKIDVGTRSGWIRDDSFSIDSRSDSCP